MDLMTLFIMAIQCLLVATISYYAGHAKGYDKGFKDGESGNGYF